MHGSSRRRAYGVAVITSQEEASGPAWYPLSPPFATVKSTHTKDEVDEASKRAPVEQCRYFWWMEESTVVEVTDPRRYIKYPLDLRV